MGYSIGRSVGDTFEESRQMKFRYIFNWVAPVIVYRWGILGTLLLIFILSAVWRNWRRESKGLNDAAAYKVIKIDALLILLAFETFLFFGWPYFSFLLGLIIGHRERKLKYNEKNLS